MMNFKTYVFILIFNIVLFSKFVKSYQVFDIENPDQNLVFSTSDSGDGPVLARTFSLKSESNVVKVKYGNENIWTSGVFGEKVVSIQIIKAYGLNKLLTIDTLNNGLLVTYYFRWLQYSWRSITNRGYLSIRASIRVDRVLNIKPPFDTQTFEIHHNQVYGMESTTIVTKDEYEVRKVNDGDNTVWTGNINLKCRGAIIHGPIQAPKLMQLHLIRLENEHTSIYLYNTEGGWVAVLRPMFYNILARLDAEEEQRRRDQSAQNQ
ncbi:hypothetical protein TpMuguga_02g00214 [Theileria parva strain Muguga]|uniref:Uncharacterized protein n=1 Tax=Theileria parva TaxID=5875 RepID=Q4N5S6_THEPA|nr:uncharacterized protein TpMuguga_02g00214 [Theileria parva strain Muguga]EAN32497.1 hypothetical protein TpMuguga_02g00214 [Theileria parva strain Muguga]|eukprot:XP_764780.1 hypothetical protein [Theileria parva strain Muguga]